MPHSFSCPSCGAEIVFKSTITVYGICASCKSTVLRNDSGVERIGEVAEVPDDLSPLKIASTGLYKGHSFEILGRLKVQWEEGLWNEWYCVFGSGRDAWLAEAQGFWGLCFRRDLKDLPHPTQMKVGGVYNIDKYGPFLVDDRKTNKVVAAEGELPFKAPLGLERFSVDLTGENRRFATAEVCEGATRLYVGRYLSLRELRMKGLREIEGWPRWNH